MLIFFVLKDEIVVLDNQSVCVCFPGEDNFSCS